MLPEARTLDQVSMVPDRSSAWNHQTPWGSDKTPAPGPVVPKPPASRGPWRSLGLGFGSGLLAGLVILAALVAGGLYGARPIQAPEPPPQTPTPSGRAHPHDYTYLNQGYQVPGVTRPVVPLPEVPEDEAETFRTENVIYKQTLPGPNACPYDPTDMRERDQIQRIMDDTVGCLMAAWDRPIHEAGYQLPRPAINLVSASAITPCGTVRHFAGLYCQVNQAMYLHLSERPAFRSDGQRTYAMEVILAHEFGHHIQARTGLLEAARTIQQQSTNKDEMLLENRRIEMQADCFSGLAVATLARSWNLTAEDLEALEENRAARASQTHGNAQNRTAWFRKGIDAQGNVGACNTFAAPEDEVA